MQDFESVALGLTVRAPKGPKVVNDHINMSHAELSIVSRLPNSTEYNIILRIMEGELEKLETEHMKSYEDKDLFERTGLGCVFARRFYEKIQNEINYHSSEYRGMEEDQIAQKKIEQLTPEQILRAGFGLDA